MKKKILYGGGEDYNILFFFFLKICREKIYQSFEKEIFNFKKIGKILDIGTSPIDSDYQNYLIHKYPLKEKITCVSNVKLKKIKKKYPKIKTLQCDGRKIPLKDNTFDIVMSNATLEHVGNNNNQIKFVKESIRLCKKLVFISTPNRYFPIDFHTLLPFIHWLPKKMHRLLLKKLNLDFFAKESNLNLLSINNLKEICSNLKIENYKIIRVRLFFFTTNLILIIKKN